MSTRIFTSEELQSRWSDWASPWEIHYEPITLPVTQTLLTWSNLRTATSILEVACGSGLGSSMCNLQKPKNAQLTCIDLSPAMVERAIKKINDPSVKVLAANAEQLPFEDQSFDRYYASFCLHLVSDPDKMLKEALRVLKPGGTAVFSVWGRRENCAQMYFMNEIADQLGIAISPPGPPARSPFHLGTSEQELRQRALDNGFSKSVAFYQQHPTPSLDPATVTEKILAPPTVVEAFNKLTPQQQETYKKKLDEYTATCVASGKPVPMEALILVASK